MEVKETEERVVIAKPVASRPSCSTFKTFTELLTDSVTVSPKSNRYDIPEATIRPKTLRFKQPTASVVSCPLGEGKSCADSDSRNYVVYKPKAKLVSKATVSALANMLQGNRQQTWRQTESVSNGKSVSQGTHRTGLNLVQKVPSFTESDTSNADRSSSSVDGYNWRKYGQKQVKGSECPRSYYKCTHPKCPVKKKVERSLQGQVLEIVYQGEHNHSKPSCPLPRRASSSSSSGFQKPPKGLVASEGSIGQQDPTNIGYYPLWSNDRTEKMNEGCVVTPFEFAVPKSANSTGGTSDSGCRSSQCDDEVSNGEPDDDPTRNKKSGKNEKQSSEVGGVSQGSVESDSLEDGFRWRKYGQKVVGGNAYPRSYYRCTSVNCRARKHVERASDDPRAFITTYEGKHNHHLILRPPSSPTLPHFSSPQHSKQTM